VQRSWMSLLPINWPGCAARRTSELDAIISLFILLGVINTFCYQFYLRIILFRLNGYDLFSDAILLCCFVFRFLYSVGSLCSRTYILQFLKESRIRTKKPILLKSDNNLIKYLPLLLCLQFGRHRTFGAKQPYPAHSNSGFSCAHSVGLSI